MRRACTLRVTHPARYKLQVASSGLAVAVTSVAAVRVGFHLGKGDALAAQKAMWITIVATLVAGALALLPLDPDAACSM